MIVCLSFFLSFLSRICPELRKLYEENSAIRCLSSNQRNATLFEDIVFIVEQLIVEIWVGRYDGCVHEYPLPFGFLPNALIQSLAAQIIIHQHAQSSCMHKRRAHCTLVCPSGIKKNIRCTDGITWPSTWWRMCSSCCGYLFRAHTIYFYELCSVRFLRFQLRLFR